MTKIISWNVNGVRAGFKKGTMQEVFATEPEAFCIQETKAEFSQLTEMQQNVSGYFCNMHSSSERKGYSGVAIYSKEEPSELEYGILKDGQQFDFQGRVLTAYFNDYILVNSYLPNGGRNQERLEYKLEFYELFQKHIVRLRQYDLPVVVVGDFNVAHNEIDLARPKANKNSTGFLPQERSWLSKLLGSQWVDVFRFFYPDKIDAYTYWDQITRSRERNVGWRIDYALIDLEHIGQVREISLLKEQFGSDHCPVQIKLNSFT